MSNLTITANPNYRILPDLTEEEYEALKASIAEVGVLIPIETDENGITLDGYHRVRACEELGIVDYPTITRPGLTEEEKRAHIIELNAVRRHLTPAKMRELILLLRRDGRSTRSIAKTLTTSKSTVSRALADCPGDDLGLPSTVKGEDGKNHPVRKRRTAVFSKNATETARSLVVLGQLDPNDLPNQMLDARGVAKLGRKVEGEKRVAELLATYPPQTYDGNLELDTVRCCDIRDLDIPADSVDHILTDPTHDEDSVALYGILAELAARVLKPGAYCIAYTSNWHLPEVIEAMGRNLEYVWAYVELQPQSDLPIHQKHLWGKHRILLVFKKAGQTARREWVPDAISTAREKGFHEGQQAEATPRLYIPAYTYPGDVVLDPFVGDGTTAAVCKALGRHFLAFDKDPVAVAATLDRLSRVEFEGPDDDGGDDPDGGDGDDHDGTDDGEKGAVPSSVGGDSRTSAPGEAEDVPATSPSDSVPMSSNLPLERAARAPAGQLEAGLAKSSDGAEFVTISRGGLPLVRVPVIRERLSNRRFVRPAGNRKCEHVMSVCNACSEACFRALTWFDDSHRPCFSDMNGVGGCFGNCTEVSRQRRSKKRLYNVAFNGVVNGLAKVRLPKDDDFTLPRPEVSDPLHQPFIYRTDGESTDGSLSISLGLLQRFAESNPEFRFLSFCSDYFRPSDEKLRRLASLKNCWTSHTVSGWFGSEELEFRYQAIARFIKFGVPTVVSICSREDWDNDGVLRRILELVPEDRVIEAPFRTGNHAQERPLLGINPRGACGDQRYDGKDRLVQIIEENGKSRYVVPLPDGGFEKSWGSVHARCRGCKVLCGYWAVFGDAPPNSAKKTSAAPRVVAAKASGEPPPPKGLTPLQLSQENHLTDDEGASAALVTASGAASPEPCLPSLDEHSTPRSIGEPARRYRTVASGRIAAANFAAVDTRTVRLDGSPTFVDPFCGSGGFSHGSVEELSPSYRIRDLDEHEETMPVVGTRVASIEDDWQRPSTPRFLSWPGAKHRQLLQILRVLPHRERPWRAVVEPFFGTGAFTWRVMDPVVPQTFFAAESDDHMFWWWHNMLFQTDKMVRNMAEVRDRFGPASSDRAVFEGLRGLYNEGHASDPHSAETAALLWVLIYQSTNNLARFNSRGEYNQTWGKGRRVPDPTAVFDEASVGMLERFREMAPITTEPLFGDFRPMLDEFERWVTDDRIVSSDCIAFLDPPYILHTETYQRGCWSIQDETDMWDRCERLDAMGVPWVMTNYLWKQDSNSGRVVEHPLRRRMEAEWQVQHLDRGVDARPGGTSTLCEEVLILGKAIADGPSRQWDSSSGTGAKVPQTAASPNPSSTQTATASAEWVDTHTVPMQATPTLVDLFCGCGGFSHGFAMAGFRPILGVDFDAQALETHAWNMPDARTLLARIEDLTDDDILAAVAGEDIDVVAGGPPCQGFSTAGERRPDDPRNDLFKEFVRVTSILRPHYLVMENVPGILSFEGGRVIEELMRELADVGYPGASVLTLNAAEYGVPQLRERVIIVANRHGLPNPYPLPVLQPAEFVTVDQAIGDMWGLPQGAVANHEWPVPAAHLQARMSSLPHGAPLYDSFKGGCRRFWPDRPAFTVLANNGQPHVHPHEGRFSSVREMARLQGFPDHFAFRGGLQSMMHQVGNAVPPPLAQQVALALRPSLALISAPSSANALQQVTYEVAAEPLHQLMEDLLAWRSRTRRHVGVSDLITTIISETGGTGLEVSANPDGQMVPLICHLTTNAIEDISHMAERACGAKDPSSIVDAAIRFFVTQTRYGRVHLIWESRRRQGDRTAGLARAPAGATPRSAADWLPVEGV